MSEQKTFQMGSGRAAEKKKSYDWNRISPENKKRIEAGEKGLWAKSIDEMNAIEAGEEYFYEKHSDTNLAFLLIRRERKRA